MAAWATESLPLAAAAALATGLTAAWWTERRLRSVIEPIAQIAAGDRYAALPDRIGRGPMAEMAAAAERMRQSLIDADALAVAHRSRELESKLHLAGHTFITQQFRSAINEMISAFDKAGEEILRDRRRPRGAQQGHAPAHDLGGRIRRPTPPATWRRSAPRRAISWA